jgi:hypothetical protein
MCWQFNIVSNISVTDQKQRCSINWSNDTTQSLLAEQGKYLPKYVDREFDEFLRCGRLEYGFLRVVCGDCKHEKLVAFSCKRRGFYSELPASKIPK